jgi:hypothetical protein
MLRKLPSQLCSRSVLQEGYERGLQADEIRLDSYSESQQTSDQDEDEANGNPCPQKATKGPKLSR